MSRFSVGPVAAPRVPLLLMLCAVAVVAGCAGEGGAAGSNDLDSAPNIAYEEIMRIGSVDDPDYGFSAVNGVDLDADGNIYAFEASDAQLRVYSPEGELLRRIGRRGEGPGEFRAAPRFGIHGDTIWAIESFGRRIHLFRLDGTLISTAPIQAVTVNLHRSVGNVMPVEMRDDGLFTSDMTMFSSSRDMEITVGQNDTVQVPRVLYGADGIPVDTIGWVPRVSPPSSGVSLEWVDVGGKRYMVPPPASDEPLSVTLADGRLVVDRPRATSAEPALLTLTRLGLAGDTLFTRSYSYRPRPFDDAALASAAWQSARRPGGGIRMVNGVPQPEPVPDDSMDAYERVRSAMDFPAFQSPIRAHRLADDGSIWFMREDDGGETQRWTVLAEGGGIIGEVSLTAGVYPIWMDSETFFAIERDEFDVPWLVRYRLMIE